MNTNDSNDPTKERPARSRLDKFLDVVDHLASEEGMEAEFDEYVDEHGRDGDGGDGTEAFAASDDGDYNEE